MHNGGVGSQEPGLWCWARGNQRAACADVAWDVRQCVALWQSCWLPSQQAITAQGGAHHCAVTAVFLPPCRCCLWSTMPPRWQPPPARQKRCSGGLHACAACMNTSQCLASRVAMHKLFVGQNGPPVSWAPGGHHMAAPSMHPCRHLSALRRCFASVLRLLLAAALPTNCLRH